MSDHIDNKLAIDEDTMKQFLMFQKFITLQKEVNSNNKINKVENLNDKHIQNEVSMSFNSNNKLLDKENVKDNQINQLEENNFSLNATITSINLNIKKEKVEDFKENKEVLILNEQKEIENKETNDKVEEPFVKPVAQNRNFKVLKRNSIDNKKQEEIEIIENKPIVKTRISFDDVPIKSNFSNFESLLEKEMKNNIFEVNENKADKKVVHTKISHRLKDVKVHQPPHEKTVKYKYYSDNFKEELESKEEINKKTIKKSLKVLQNKKESIKDFNKNEAIDFYDNKTYKEKFDLVLNNKIKNNHSKDNFISKIDQSKEIDDNENIQQNSIALEKSQVEEKNKENEVKINVIQESVLLNKEDLQETLKKEIEIYHNKNTQLNLLIRQQKELNKKLDKERQEFQREKQREIDDFEKFKENEIKYIKKMKHNLGQVQTLKVTSKKDNDEISNLRNALLKTQEESKLKDYNSKMLIESLKKQLSESNNLLEKISKGKLELNAYDDYDNNTNNTNNTNRLNSAKSKQKFNTIYPKPTIKEKEQSKEILPVRNNRYSNIKSRINSNITNKRSSSTNPHGRNDKNYDSNEKKEFTTTRKYNALDNSQELTNDNNQNDFSREEIKLSDLVKNSNKDKQALNIKKYKEDNDKYDLYFPKQYSFEKVLIKQEKLKDNKLVNFYDNDIREVVFPSGVIKEIHPDGYQVVNFPNKDIKQLFPDGKMIYFFFESKTIQSTVPNDKLQVFKFSNGQIEKHFEDGTKQISFPDGMIKVISKEGIEHTVDYSE